MDNKYENIVPWNGANDTGRDVRMKLERNFAKVAKNFIEFGDNKVEQDEVINLILEELKKFLRKDKEDTAQELITFLKGLLIGKNGSGITALPDGTSQAVVDRLYVKIKAVFDELEVKKKTYVGGEQVLSPAGMKCIKVEELDTSYRCYFKAEEDGVEIENQFTVGTFAMSQECNIKVGISHNVGNRFYWRTVTSVGIDFIELSKTDCFDPSDSPSVGDDIIGFGHKDDITRQGAIVLSSVNEVSPSIIMYQGINNFTYAGKEVISFDYDKATGKARMRVYGDTYIGAKDRSAYIELVDDKVYVKAQLDILPGSTGFENVDGMEFGKVNLLRNSGFTGDYNSAKLEDETQLTDDTELYNQAVKWWTATNATINYEDTESKSGRSVGLNLGALVQTLYYKLYKGERYVLSFRAKGSSVTINVGGFEQMQVLTPDYDRYVFKFEASETDTDISFIGTCTITELQLERGTILSVWSVSPLDNNSFETKFEALRYLTDSIREGSSSFVGGLGLLSTILVGNYSDGEMKQVTGGLSGTYNDDYDVLLWGGGDLEKAINAVNACKDNPKSFLEMSDSELANIAKTVLTHGGKTILSDAVVRGYIYALGGYFRGTFDAASGTTHFDEDGTGCIGKALDKYFAKWDAKGNGSLCFDNIKWDAVKKLLTVAGQIDAKNGSKIGNLEITGSGAMIGSNIVFENCSNGYNFGTTPSNAAEYIKNIIINNIGKSNSYQLVFNISGGTYPVFLPNHKDVVSAMGTFVGGGFDLKIFVPAKWGMAGSSPMENESRFTITGKEQANIYDQDGNKMESIEMCRGDFLELYGIVSTDYPLPGSTFGIACIDYYIKSLNQ